MRTRLLINDNFHTMNQPTSLDGCLISQTLPDIKELNFEVVESGLYHTVNAAHQSYTSIN